MEQEIVYNLSAIPGFNECIKDKKVLEAYEKYYTINEYFTKSNEKYYILKYCKEFMNSDIINKYGLLRSVILSSTGKVLSFSPQKSQNPEYFVNNYNSLLKAPLYAEEFIEGTMINAFFNSECGVSGCWQIATRNTVGAEVSYFNWDSKYTFNKMFMEACAACNFNINTLNPEYCYSFVLQHPNNRIVVPIKTPQLYLVSVYKIENNEVDNEIKMIQQPLQKVIINGMWNKTSIKFPASYPFTSYSELIKEYASANTSYNIVGIIVKNGETGERTKFRNPIYEEVKYLRGNQPKLQYQYLHLRKEGKLPEFIKYYPELKPELSKFRDEVHMFTNTLHQNYISCYVKKEKPLNQYPNQYRTHMYKLHEMYLNELKPGQLFVTNTVAQKYVNNLHPSLLMYCLNYNMRKKAIDTLKIHEQDTTYTFFN